ncbi:MAG TPA: Fic family protein [Egibacteraceae bacterium]|nr:Fic family protein [Egibacteraceae bacterium]
MRFSYSDHLVSLVADAGAAAARLAAADPAARQAHAAAARREYARLSARLDASPLTDATADKVDERESRGLPPSPQQAGSVSPAARVTAGWARTLKIDEAATQEVAALEYANLLAAFDVESAVAPGIFDDPRRALADLHAVLCRGLVDPALAGHARRTELAVHEGAQGRVIYHPAPPARIDALLDELATWLTGPGGAKPALVVAGVVHERILQWQPYEAANGRLARAASRLVLRARGVDPDGLAVAERLPAADPLAYHSEVAATIRRRDDLGRWLERAAEAVVAGLAAAADAVAPRPACALPARALAIAAELAPGAALTVADYADRAGASRASARAELRALAGAGFMEMVPATGGLRFRRGGQATSEGDAL